MPITQCSNDLVDVHLPCKLPKLFVLQSNLRKMVSKSFVALLQLHNKYMNDKAINCDFYLMLSANSHYIGSIFMNVYAPNYGSVK